MSWVWGYAAAATRAAVYLAVVVAWGLPGAMAVAVDVIVHDRAEQAQLDFIFRRSRERRAQAHSPAPAPGIQRCPLSGRTVHPAMRGLAGQVPCPTCDQLVDLITNPDGGPGPAYAHHDLKEMCS